MEWQYDCRDDSTAFGTSLSSFSGEGSKSLIARSSQDDRPLVSRLNCGQERVAKKIASDHDAEHLWSGNAQRNKEPGVTWKRSDVEMEVGESMPDWLRFFADTELNALKKGLQKESQAAWNMPPMSQQFGPIIEDDSSSRPDFFAETLGSHCRSRLQENPKSAGCSNGIIAGDKGDTELSEAFQDIENLKFHMHRLSAQYYGSQARFDEMEESLANRLRLFAYHCSHEQMQDLEECILQELCRSASFRRQEEAVQCGSDDRNLIMPPQWSLSRFEIAAATKLRDEAWRLKQESEEVAKSAMEDRRRFESHMATQREEAQRRLQEERKQWDAERHAWENEMRKVAQSAMKEHRHVTQWASQMAKNEQERKQWQADQLAWRAEATEMIQELKESVTSERQRGDSLSRHLRDYQDELHADGSRDRQARLSLQDVQHRLTKNVEEVAGAKKVVEDFGLRYTGEFSALMAMQQEAQSAQLQLEKSVNSTIASMQAVSSEVQRKCSDARQMNALTELRLEEEVAINSMREQSEMQQLLSEYNQQKARERLAQLGTKYEDLDNEHRVERRRFRTDAEAYLRRRSSLSPDTTFSRMQKQVRPRSHANLREALSQSSFQEPGNRRMHY